MHVFSSCCYRSFVQSAVLVLALSTGLGSSVPAGSGWSPPSRYTGQKLMKLELLLKESQLFNDFHYFWAIVALFVRLLGFANLKCMHIAHVAHETVICGGVTEHAQYQIPRRKLNCLLIIGIQLSRHLFLFLSLISDKSSRLY